tara:strand:- start:1167 stop:1613 length:447 start_codon:yes stop_codon:yes gene_type:complete
MASSIETDVALLKKDVDDLKTIHRRLDSAIEKIADVSQSLHTIMAVHEERISKQEESLETQEKRLNDSIQELHSRVTTNSKELRECITNTENRLRETINEHSRKDNEEFKKLTEQISKRVGLLEKWRWIIIGGSIVIGFAIQKLPIWG